MCGLAISSPPKICSTFTCSHYQAEKFVRLYQPGSLPDLAAVNRTNFCDIGFKFDPATGRAVIVSAIDNLVKGAAGQAIQNMNLILGCEETAGLFEDLLKVLIKLGGTLLDAAESRHRLAAEISAAVHQGLQAVVVHGGGKQMTRYLTGLGIESRFVNGLRVTTPEVLDAVVKVLAGAVNQELVAAFVACGAPAVGLSGMDALLTEARQMSEELGWVGKPVRSDARLLNSLIASGIFAGCGLPGRRSPRSILQCQCRPDGGLGCRRPGRGQTAVPDGRRWRQRRE